jgi:hypothetical protein
MAAQKNIVEYLKCIVDEDNLEFEKIHKMITKTINNQSVLEDNVIMYKQHECVM